MTRDEFALNVSRFATVALLILFATKLALADGQNIPFTPGKASVEKMKIDFPYQTETP